MPDRILICSTCARSAGSAREEAEALRAALASAGLDIDVGQTACLGACADPVTLAVQGTGRASYVFSGLAPAEMCADVVAFCRLFRDAPGGWIEDARPAGALRHHLRARLPAFPGAADDQS